MAFMIVEYKSRAALLQGEQRDSAVNINTYRVLQRHRAVSRTQHGFLVCIRGCSNGEITVGPIGCDAKITAILDSQKSRHTTKITVKDTVIVNTVRDYPDNDSNVCYCSYRFYIAFIFWLTLIIIIIIIIILYICVCVCVYGPSCLN